MRSLLEAGLQHYRLTSTPQICDILIEYLSLLDKWNKTYNLTAVRTRQEMLQRHVLDSCSIQSFIKGPRCLDVGTGPGLPGLVLAILQPDKHWLLLDSNQKKVRFLRHVQLQLKLENVEVVQSRVESYKAGAGFNTIVCRAFSSLQDFVNKSSHLLATDGVLLAMKAKPGREELEPVICNVASLDLIELDTMGQEDSRCLVRIQP